MLSDEYILASSRTYPGPRGVQTSLVLRAGDTETAGSYKGWVVQWDYAQELFVTLEVGA
jgi:hypothetical protein